MPVRRSLTAVPGAVHLNRAESVRVRHVPRRPPRATPLTLRFAPRAITATHAQASRRPRGGGPCRRLPGGFMTGAIVHEDAFAVLRRWARRRFD